MTFSSSMRDSDEQAENVDHSTDSTLGFGSLDVKGQGHRESKGL